MRPLLKYCGNHSLADLRVSIDSQADFIGVVFAESKRQVKPSELQEWLQAVSLKPNQKLVGLFVNASLEAVASVLEHVSLDLIQCHGTESVAFIKELKDRFSLPIWKVIHHSDAALAQMKDFAGVVDGYVVDSKVKGQWGGTGTTFDWSHVPNYVREGKQQGVPVLIAGGIHADNLEQLLQMKPAGIDLSSGIERDGSKHTDEIKRLEMRFVENE